MRSRWRSDIDRIGTQLKRDDSGAPPGFDARGDERSGEVAMLLMEWSW
jgi:hypothetical protein